MTPSSIPMPASKPRRRLAQALSNCAAMLERFCRTSEPALEPGVRWTDRIERELCHREAFARFGQAFTPHPPVEARLPSRRPPQGRKADD